MQKQFQNLGDSGEFAVPTAQIVIKTLAGTERESSEYTEADLAIRRVRLTQSLDRPGRLSAHLITDDLQFDVDGLVLADFSLLIRRDGIEAERCFGGVVTRAEYLGTFARQLHVGIEVQPAAGTMDQCRRTRVFQQLTTPEIVKEVFKEVSESRDRKLIERLQDDYLKRDYCVQYRETDLDFIARILAEEGIAFTFDHSDADIERERLVLVDANASYVGLGEPHQDGDTAPTDLLVLTGETDVQDLAEGITSLSWSRRPEPHYVESSARDWKTAATARIHGKQEEQELEPWHYGHCYEHDLIRVHEEVTQSEEPGPQEDETEAWASFAHERARAAAVVAEGTSNAIHMEPGHTFNVMDHPYEELHREFLVTNTLLVLENPSADNSGNGGGGTFDVSFRAIPLDVPYRPARRSRPQICGPHTATVVGPPDEEIYTDEHGRIKVRFHWDREGEERGDHLTSCWCG